MTTENSTTQSSTELVTSPKPVYITETPPPVTKGNNIVSHIFLYLILYFAYFNIPLYSIKNYNFESEYLHYLSQLILNFYIYIYTF
jgi:hypothetical protein